MAPNHPKRAYTAIVVHTFGLQVGTIRGYRALLGLLGFALASCRGGGALGSEPPTSPARTGRFFLVLKLLPKPPIMAVSQIYNYIYTCVYIYIHMCIELLLSNNKLRNDVPPQCKAYPEFWLLGSSLEGQPAPDQGRQKALVVLGRLQSNAQQ